MKKYLKDLEEELRKNNLSEKEITEILADHREMIETAKNEGLGEEELNIKFGDPKNVAKELSDFSELTEKPKIDKKTRDFKFDKVEEDYKINIALMSEDIALETTEQDYILVELSKQVDVDKIDIKFEDNTLLISSEKRKAAFTFKVRLKSMITVKIPKNIKAADIIMKTLNGDVELTNIVSKDLILGTNNGDLDASNINVKELKLSTINGDIQMNSIKSHHFQLSTISGDIDLTDSIVEDEFRINTVSGDLDFNNVVCNELNLKTVSGDLEGKDVYPKELSLSTVSGDIQITNSDNNRPIRIKNKRTVSGDIDIYIK